MTKKQMQDEIDRLKKENHKLEIKMRRMKRIFDELEIIKKIRTGK